MKREDYKNAARLLRKKRMTVPTDDWVAALLFCIELFSEDPNFDEPKFREACYA